MRLLLCLMLVFAFACNEAGPLVGPEEDVGATAAKRDEAKMIPVKGQGFWAWDGTFLPPSESCANAGGNASAVYRGVANISHLGRVTVHVSPCLDLVAWALLYGRETWTAANGDQIVVYSDTRLSDLPEGSTWGYYNVVESGTGRFEGVVGEVITHGTIEADPPGARGIENFDGFISSVGTSQ